RVAIRGRNGSGRRTLAAGLAARSSRELGLVELAAGPLADVIAQLRRDLREVHARGWIACVSNVDRAIAADPMARDQVRAVLDAHPGPLFVRLAPAEVAPLATDHASIELPTLAVADRAEAWRRALADAGLATDAAGELAQRYAVGPGIARR